MNEKEIVKIRGFINETDMAKAVHDLIYRTFLQKRSTADVHILAAQTLAVQFLEEAWVEMERHKLEAKRSDERKNVGI